MTDRAAVMKQFGRQLEEVRADAAADEPAEHVQLEFMNCNAHFLLGVQTAADAALLEVIQTSDLKGKLGRDTLSSFLTFTPINKSEVPPTR